MFDLNSLLRKNIQLLEPYASARTDYSGKEGIFLDANENAYGSPLDGNLNRYPDPFQTSLKTKLSSLNTVPESQIFLSNGSDEAIDLILRAFCNPGIDNILICPPTYGMYEVSAGINDVVVKKVSLTPEHFQLNVSGMKEAIDAKTKLIFLCCPNNPTGNGVKWTDIKTLLDTFSGLVVVDEAYISFASYPSLVSELKNYPNLIVMQTLSKAWGLAGIRIGTVFASEEIVGILNKIKPPYNISSVNQEMALLALDKQALVHVWVKKIVEQRRQLAKALSSLSFVETVYPSEANFLLVKMLNARNVYEELVKEEITVGTETENDQLLLALSRLEGRIA
jgi:histidinol-phosphate aminotransferase